MNILSSRLALNPFLLRYVWNIAQFPRRPRDPDVQLIYVRLRGVYYVVSPLDSPFNAYIITGSQKRHTSGKRLTWRQILVRNWTWTNIGRCTYRLGSRTTSFRTCEGIVLSFSGTGNIDVHIVQIIYWNIRGKGCLCVICCIYGGVSYWTFQAIDGSSRQKFLALPPGR